MNYKENHNAFLTFAEIDGTGKKSITGKYTVSAEDYEKLTTLAKRSYSAMSEVKELREHTKYLNCLLYTSLSPPRKAVRILLMA